MKIICPLEILALHLDIVCKISRDRDGKHQCCTDPKWTCHTTPNKDDIILKQNKQILCIQLNHILRNRQIVTVSLCKDQDSIIHNYNPICLLMLRILERCDRFDINKLLLLTDMQVLILHSNALRKTKLKQKIL